MSVFKLLFFSDAKVKFRILKYLVIYYRQEKGQRLEKSCSYPFMTTSVFLDVDFKYSVLFS